MTMAPKDTTKHTDLHIPDPEEFEPDAVRCPFDDMTRFRLGLKESGRYAIAMQCSARGVSVRIEHVVIGNVLQIMLSSTRVSLYKMGIL